MKYVRENASKKTNRHAINHIVSYNEINRLIHIIRGGQIQTMGVQKKKLLHRIMALVIAVAVGLSVIVPGGISAEAATIPADVTKPSANCVFIAMKGKYVSEASAAVKRINQIRYEACKQGVKIDGRKLTLDDYVPIKWSAGLEKIARIRAAEASVTMYHSRLNGKSVFDFKYPGNGWPTSEVLAWNWSESMLMGIEQWYSEKEDRKSVV